MPNTRKKTGGAGRSTVKPYVKRLSDVDASLVAEVGGKNASLGELLGKLQRDGVRVCDGFTTTAAAYTAFLDANDLRNVITAKLAAWRQGKVSLAAAGSFIRKKVLAGQFPADVARDITRAYADLCRVTGQPTQAVAVRSSATAEDLPSASFAGQHDTYLNISGRAAVLAACRRCIASLFNDRAISYREKNGFDHMRTALAVGVQRMVRSDKGAAGVMFTLDTESGFPDVVRIEGAWGLGEMVVQGAVSPDSYMVFKPLLAKRGKAPIIEKTLGQKRQKMIYGGLRHRTSIVATSAQERVRFVLTDKETLQLARWAVAIERHYGRPMDIEWAKDGRSGQLFILQARPETVQSQVGTHGIRTFSIRKTGRKLVTGLAVGDAVASGIVHRIKTPADAARFPVGGILVTKITDPDWVPVMRRAAAIITDQGGRTSHAAIVSREFGLPAIVGAGNATTVLREGQLVTVSCAEGDQGRVYEGKADFKSKMLDLSKLPATRTKVMLNMADPAAALRWWRLPADGIGLARMEFIISSHIKIHPLALARFATLKDKAARTLITEMTRGYKTKSDYFVDRLSLGIARLAAVQYPRPVIVRMSDFKTNEYAALIGGQQFEPKEENPMIGWRGASRYYSPDYRDGFALECKAISKVRRDIGLDNVIMMIPFCRTPEEADKVLAEMASHGLKRGVDGLQVYVMCEIPSNVILAADFARRFDGFSIGSNDLTQLTLGVDRDSHRLAGLFKEDNAAVTTSIQRVITEAGKARRKTGFCGQAPSDHPAYARFLVDAGIDSVSVTPDSFLAVKRQVAAAERVKKRRRRR